MLDNLLDIEVAYSLLKSGEEDLAKDPLDVNYEKLNTDLEVNKYVFFLSLESDFFPRFWRLPLSILGSLQRLQGIFYDRAVREKHTRRDAYSVRAGSTRGNRVDFLLFL